MEVKDDNNMCLTKNTSDSCETDCDSYSAVSEISNIRPVLLNKTQNTHDFCEIASNSYLKDCTFLGFCNLCKDESVISTKYKYFCEFIKGAYTSFPEVIKKEDILDHENNSNRSGFSTNAIVETIHEHLDRHSNKLNCKINTHTGKKEKDIKKVVPLKQRTRKLKKIIPKIKEEVVDDDDVIMTSEFPVFIKLQPKEEVVDDDDVIMTSEFPVFIKLQPIRVEKFPDPYEKYEIKSGIFDVSASLDSDFENYAESSDGVSDNSDEEIDNTKMGIIVHKPLKDYANRLAGSLTIDLFSKPDEAQERNYFPKPILICSTPGIGHIKVIELVEETCIEKLVIEDPVDHRLKHQFLNNGHASSWLDKFFQKKMTFEFGVRLQWLLLTSTMNKRASDFNPEILKDKSLIVTERGVQKLSINDPKELSRFHYRKKLENNATKLACFIPSVVNICKVPLPFLLHKANEEIEKQNKTFFDLQYELQMESLKCKRLKRKLMSFRD